MSFHYSAILLVFFIGYGYLEDVFGMNLLSVAY